MRQRALPLCCIAIGAAFLARATAGQMSYTDSIRPKKDVLFFCRILSEDIDKVVYRLPGEPADKTILQRDIAYVKYSDTPRKITDADKYFEEKQYVRAINDYRQGMRDPNVRKFWAEPHCMYRIGECYLHLEPPKLDEAFRELSELNEKHPRNKFMAEAKVKLAEIQEKRGKHSEALTAYQQVEKERDAKGEPRFSEKTRTAAAFGMVRCMLALKQHDEALDKLKKLQAQIGDEDFDLAYRVAAQRVAIYLGMEDFSRAREESEAIISKAKRQWNDLVGKKEMATKGRALRRALATCYNALGDAHMASQAKDNVREALVNYMWVVALFDESAEEHAKALLKAGQCRMKLGQKAKAQLLWKELKQRHPRSEWTTRIPKDESAQSSRTPREKGATR